MEDRPIFDVLTQEAYQIEFEIVALQKTVECRLSAKMTLKKAIESLKYCLKAESMAWFDFNDVIVMNPNTSQYLIPMMSLKECGCTNGCRLLVY